MKAFYSLVFTGNFAAITLGGCGPQWNRVEIEPFMIEVPVPNCAIEEKTERDRRFAEKIKMLSDVTHLEMRRVPSRPGTVFRQEPLIDCSMSHVSSPLFQAG